MNTVGYAWLHERLKLSAFPVQHPAIIQPVTRLGRIGETLAVPTGMAPDADDLLGHVLFALKHEGVNLSILAQVLPTIPIESLEAGHQMETSMVGLSANCRAPS